MLIQDEMAYPIDGISPPMNTLKMKIRKGIDVWRTVELTSADRLHYHGKFEALNTDISVNVLTGLMSITECNGRPIAEDVAICYPIADVTRSLKPPEAKPIPPQIKGKRLHRGDVVQKPFYIQHGNRGSHKSY